MTNLQVLIEERVDAMVNDVLATVRASAIEAVERALVSSRRSTAPKSAKIATTGGGRRVNTAPPKRSPAELRKLGEQLYALIDATSGETMSFYASQLGTASGQLAVPMRKLKAAGRLRSVGERSDTKYFPMGPPAGQ